MKQIGNKLLDGYKWQIRALAGNLGQVGGSEKLLREGVVENQSWKQVKDEEQNMAVFVAVQKDGDKNVNCSSSG